MPALMVDVLHPDNPFVAAPDNPFVLGPASVISGAGALTDAQTMTGSGVVGGVGVGVTGSGSLTSGDTLSGSGAVGGVGVTGSGGVLTGGETLSGGGTVGPARGGPPPAGWNPDARVLFHRPAALPWPYPPLQPVPAGEPVLLGMDRLSPDSGPGVVYGYDAAEDVAAFGLTASQTTVTASVRAPGSLTPTPAALVVEVVITGTLIYAVLGDVSALAEGSIVTLEWRVGVASVPAATVVATAQLIVSSS